MSDPRSHAALRSARSIAMTLALVAAALAARALAGPWLGSALPFVTLFAAIAVATLVLDHRHGLLAAGLGYLGAAILFIEPSGSFALDRKNTGLELLLYAISSATIVAVGAGTQRARRQAEEHRRRAIDRQLLLEREAEARARAEELLGRAHAWNRGILDSIGEPFYVLDADWKFVYLNDHYQRYIGRTRDELIGRVIWEVLPQLVGGPAEEHLRRAVRDRVTVQYEMLSPVTHRWLEVHGYPNPEGLAVFLHDITERRLSADLLAFRQTQLRLITDSIPALIAYVDAQGCYRLVNRAYESWFGRPASELIGRHVREILGAKWETIEPHFRAVLAGHEVTFETHLHSHDGTVHWVRVQYAPDRAEDGTVRGYVALISDLTDYKRHEESLRRSEEKHRRIIETANEGIWMLDAEGRVTFVNRRMTELLGYSAGEMVGRFKWDFTPEEERERLRGLFERRRAGISEQADVCFRRRDGGTVWALMAARAVIDETGFQGSLDLFTDVTARRRAEDTVRALLNISSRLNASLDLDPLLDTLVVDAIALLRAESGVAGLRTPEGMASRHYHLRGEKVPLEYVWPPGHGLPGWLIEHRVPYLTNDASNDPQILRELCDRYGVRQALSVPILNARQEGLGFIEIHNRPDGFGPADQDLLLAVSQIAAAAIENALAYRSVQRAEESLKQADRRKDEFLATLAHELRNPLAPIRNALELMRQPGASRIEQQIARDMIDRQMQQMVRLVDDLLEVSRITRGRLELRRRPIELAAAVQNAIETARPLIEAAQHQFTVRLPAEPIPLEADVTRVAQVVSNLLQNAAKYTDPGGRIELEVAREGGEAVIRVRDTGIGIAPEHLPHVFEMFAQVTPALERSQGGLGIGLALARSLIELHGGRLEARSEGIGKGSEFVVWLPAAETVAPPAAEAAGPAAGAGRAVRVLVVDDNRDNAESLSMLLRLMGHEVETRHDGAQAVEAASSFLPDVALLDIGLPTLNGYEAARRIRDEAKSRSMLLVAVTGWGQEEHRQRSREAGFDHHLIKPIDPAALRQILASAAPAPAG